MKQNKVPWTDAELALIRDLAPTHSGPQIAAMLPGRSVWSVQRQMHKVLRKRRGWTPGDDLTLEALWGSPIEEVAATLKRTRLAVWLRAGKLGLGRGVPAGCERLTQAARRCGYDVSQLRPILAWAHVRIHRSLAVERLERTRYWVTPDEVDAAVARWLRRDDERKAA